MAERPARRKKSSKSVEELKAEISARDEVKAQRAAARKKPKAMTSAEKYEQEKAARVNKGSSGYGYSQHLMGGSPSSSGFNPRTVREEVLVDYLLGEGFASDEKSAQAIIGAMSEEWKQSVIEAREEEGKSKEEKRRIRTERSGRTGPHADYERRGAHRERDERSKDLADIRKGKKNNSSHFSYLP